MANIFTRAIDGVRDRLPPLRKPETNSAYLDLLDDYSWILSERDKNYGIGWHTYYRAGKNVWVFACIQAYLDTVRNLGFKIKSPEENYQNVARVDYLTNLFNNPMGLKSNETFSTLHSAMWKSLLLLGDSFVEIINSEKYTKLPIGFKHIPTELMHYYEDTDQWGFINNGHRFENDEILHIKEPSIRGSVWGTSRIDVLAKDLSIEILGRDFTKEILERKGLDPSGVIEYSKDINDVAYDKEISRLQALAKSGRKGTMVLRGAKFNSVGITQEDMQYTELMTDIRDRILAVYGVPHSMVSLTSQNLHEDSVLSQNRAFKKRFNGTAKLFEDGFQKVLGRSTFRELFQYNEMDIDDELTRAQIDDIRLKNGSLTINESRKNNGLPPLIEDSQRPDSLNGYKSTLMREGLLKRI